MQINQINTKDIESLQYEDIMFFMLAEGGAMGEPGAVNIIMTGEDGVQICHGNYCYGDLDMDKLADVFIPLQTFNCGIFGQASGIAPGWNHISLGAGNHLLVRDCVYEQFKNAVDGKREPEIYQCYMEVAVKILADKKE